MASKVRKGDGQSQMRIRCPVMRGNLGALGFLWGSDISGDKGHDEISPNGRKVHSEGLGVGQGNLTGAGGVGDPPRWLLGEAWSLAKGVSYTEPCPFLVAA